MKIPLHIAEKLALLSMGQRLPASTLRHAVIDKFVADGMLLKQVQGRSKAFYYLSGPDSLPAYLQNHFGINDLLGYITALTGAADSRAGLVAAASDSKLKQLRTFKGFLINVVAPMPANYQGRETVLLPGLGTVMFVHDPENFLPPESATIVGVENPENFFHAEMQKAMFADINPLFVSRYPQSGDLVKWLKSIPNPYLHFGDFDFAALGIYLHEYKRHLGAKATLYVPTNLEALMAKYGNRSLYDQQLHLAKQLAQAHDTGVQMVAALLHKHKKGLEQEIYLLPS